MNLACLFTPNAKVDGKTSWMIVGGWITFLLLFWTLTPMALLPKPNEVAAALTLQAANGAIYQLLVSLLLSLEALAYATVIGLGLVYLSTFAAFRPPVKWLGWLRFLSLTGLILIFIQATHSGHALKVAVLTFAIVVFLVTDMLQVVEDIPQEKFDYARASGLNRWQVLREVVIRGTLADAFESIRMNAAMAWMMLTMVEGLSRSEGGIGVLLLSLQRNLSLSALFGIQLMIFAVGIAQDQIIRGIKAAACPYTVRGK